MIKMTFDFDRQTDRQTDRRGLISLLTAIALLLTTILPGQFVYASDDSISFSDPVNAISETISSNEKAGDELVVTFGKVGIGDCIILKCGGEAAAIDGGVNKYRKKVRNIVNSMGISKFKFLVNTHSHKDHADGLRYIVNNYECGDIFVNGLVPEKQHNRKLAGSVEKKGKSLKPLYKNDVLTLGTAIITVLGPTQYNTTKGRIGVNNNSLVLLVQHGSKRLLITGDALVQEQNELINSDISLSCDVLKVPHHAMKNASNDRLIKASNAKYAVCSCPKYVNSSKIKKWAPFNLLAENDMKVYATGYQGDIVMVSDGEKISWNMEPLIP